MTYQPVTADTLRAEVERLLAQHDTLRFGHGWKFDDKEISKALSALQPFLQQQAAVVAERDEARERWGYWRLRCEAAEAQHAALLAKAEDQARVIEILSTNKLPQPVLK